MKKGTRRILYVCLLCVICTAIGLAVGISIPSLQRWWELRALDKGDEIALLAAARADPVETARAELMAMAGSPDARERIVALRALVPYDWAPAVDITLIDPDARVRGEAAACIFNTYARPARPVAVRLAWAIVDEKDESVLRIKARTLSDLTWGRFAYEDTWTASEIRKRVKEFLPIVKAEDDRVLARLEGESTSRSGP